MYQLGIYKGKRIVRTGMQYVIYIENRNIVLSPVISNLSLSFSSKKESKKESSYKCRVSPENMISLYVTCVNIECIVNKM